MRSPPVRTPVPRLQPMMPAVQQMVAPWEESMRETEFPLTPDVPPPPEALHLEPKAWVGARTLRVLGLDPGFAEMGMAVLEKTPDQHLRVVTLEPIRTKRSDKKAMRNLRVSDDDERRSREIWNALGDALVRYKPQVIAVEQYTPFKAQGGGAFKVMRICGLIHGFALSHDVLYLSFNPQDLKRGTTGRLSASKEEVAAGLAMRVEGFDAALKKFPKGLHEHLGDAAGHAFLAFAEVQKMREMVAL